MEAAERGVMELGGCWACAVNFKDARIESSFFRWAVISSWSFLLNIGGTVFLHEIVGLTEVFSYALVLLALLSINFLGCRYYVFSSDQGQEKGFFKQFSGFLGSSVVFRFSEFLVFWFLVEVLGLYYVVVAVCVAGFFFVVKYVFYNKVLFKGASIRQRPSG